jgi:hypothetical protein
MNVFSSRLESKLMVRRVGVVVRDFSINIFHKLVGIVVRVPAVSTGAMQQGAAIGSRAI